ncbi:Ig-like domain-containing protein [Thalassoroseus pseudoceratinae]|uniref:Ig-like domain-containing protein n=1 Tax=Thalassoroseus pseudoceratinae TaxID=2713176 RepID=UPI00141DF3A2|nr:Ig-like domain-containing protein [Thalassoroseus pseudoceratinae]
MRFFVSMAMLLSMTLVLNGCGGGASDVPDVYPVSGLLKVNGQPVADVQVTFQPDSGPMSVGVTDEEGKFELLLNADTMGAVAGQHTVSFSKRGGPAGTDELIPPQFGTHSQLKETVSADGENEFEYEISAEKL